MNLATVIIYDNRELLITVKNILPKPLKRVTLQQKNLQKKKEKGGTRCRKLTLSTVLL